jgi:guanylate kinase
MKNLLLAISGPSGVGKGTLVNLLLERDRSLRLSVSCTTRAPRAGEEDGKQYFFLSKEEFERRIAADAFLEYDKHFDNYYGTPKDFVLKTLETKSVLLEIDVMGATDVKRKFPETVTIFIAPPSEKELKDRLRGRRSESDEQIETRLKRLDYELSFAKDYDYVVVNDRLEDAYGELCDIIKKEKMKR